MRLRGVVLARGSDMATTRTQTPHEPHLSPEQLDVHRATISLIEELEALDWYDQRVEACSDPALRTILAHNRDEEAEHAAMLLEWLRARRPALDEALRTYVFKPSETEAHASDTAAQVNASLAIGSLGRTR